MYVIVKYLCPYIFFVFIWIKWDSIGVRNEQSQFNFFLFYNLGCVLVDLKTFYRWSERRYRF